MMAPIIGLTTYGREEVQYQTTYYKEWFAIPTQYVDAVRRAGGVPVLLPPGESNWQRLLDSLDGVVVIGGADLHPDAYGGNGEHPELTHVDSERDRSELALVDLLAGSRPLPTLCICRGMQVANVALGGTLHEHVADVTENDIHRGADQGWAVQAVGVDKEAGLAELMGATEVNTYSGHHQALKDLGQGLRVAATAEDGIIEAVELTSHVWFVGVQWHPEVTADKDATQQRLFDELVRAAGEKGI
jgi:putative glutamine amidotransferase